MNTALENIYTQHHMKGRRQDVAVLKDTRGRFLRTHIGTGKTVLDVGCRDGELTKEYAKGNTILGLDIDTSALQRAAEKVNIQTKQVDLNDSWGVSKGEYDVVVACEVVEHLYYPDTVICKVAESLKSDGVLLGSVPNPFNIKNRIRLFLGKKEHTPLADPTHINHFTYHELETLLEKHFNIVNITPCGRWAHLDTWWPGMFSFMFLFEARNKKKAE